MATPITSNRDPKRCTRCGEEKPLTEFYRKQATTRVGRPALYDSRCKACSRAKVKAYVNHPKNRTRVLQYKRDLYHNTPKELRNVGWRERHYQRMYGSTRTAYDLQNAAQNGRCALCLRLPGEDEYRFALDHDHATGETRGVLCPSCNGGLGCFRDDPELLKAALAYLRAWAVQQAGKATSHE